MPKRILNFLLAAFTVSVIMYSCVLQNSDKDKRTEIEISSSVAPWQLGIQLWTFHLVPFTVAIEKADSCGLKYLEVYSGHPLGGVYKDSFNIRMSASSKTAVKKLLQKKGMTLVAFGVLNPKSREEWADIFVFANEMEIKVLSAEPMKEHLNYADSLAGTYGIKIAIHNHPKPASFYHPDSVLAAMTHHPNIYACADIGHWARSGLDPVKSLQQLKGRIADVHLKDIDAFDKINADNMILGKGIINLSAIFEELKAQQYNGQISIEHEQNWYNIVPDVKQNIAWYNTEMNNLFK